MHEIAVTGSVAFDHIMNFPGRFKDHILPDKLHILNVSFLVQGLQRLRGGCAANVAYALALHGLRPRLVAAVGSDFAEYGRWLEERGVDLAGAAVHGDLLTASCFITTDLDNNQITGFYPGAMARAIDARLEVLPGGRPTLAIVSPNDPAAMKAYPDECRRLGVPFLYDPGQQVIALDGAALDDGLTGAKGLVVNDYELAIVQEKTGRSLEHLLERCEAVIVTLGEHGSRVHLRGGEVVEVPVAPVTSVVDPTGAGDAYRGGLIKGLVSGADWETCGRLGALTATYCVESKGTSSYGFDRATFAARYEAAFGRSLPRGL
ncbi:MAG: carbohydrate kinase family protein [Planctomycetes bacterium]|nr:carbohydrate kinase family protein [Planctomycetota bacterium]